MFLLKVCRVAFIHAYSINLIIITHYESIVLNINSLLHLYV